ncbi:MAG TPA: helix-turn-helix domain-containing protein, partial [Sporichthyaceae bacterium]|nr:helix-turn-helix domain-containing protein [Sporichthyaceae bacterium]
TDTAAAGTRRVPPKARPQDGELLDAFAACKFLDCSGSTLRRLLASGKLHGQVLGAYNRRYYKRTALEAYLVEHPPPPGRTQT